MQSLIFFSIDFDFSKFCRSASNKSAIFLSDCLILGVSPWFFESCFTFGSFEARPSRFLDDFSPDSDTNVDFLSFFDEVDWLSWWLCFISSPGLFRCRLLSSRRLLSCPVDDRFLLFPWWWCFTDSTLSSRLFILLLVLVVSAIFSPKFGAETVVPDMRSSWSTTVTSYPRAGVAFWREELLAPRERWCRSVELFRRRLSSGIIVNRFFPSESYRLLCWSSSRDMEIRRGSFWRKTDRRRSWRRKRLFDRLLDE